MKKLFALCALVASFSSFAMPQDPPMEMNACQQQIPYGIPQTKKPNSTQICRKGYALEHDNYAKIPAWVAYVLTPGHATGCVPRSNAFAPDQSLPKGQRAELKDFANSGYDIGHQANNADMSWDPDVERESFILSNMAPQLPGFNRGIWKNLEDRTRALVLERNHPILVYVGPIYQPDDPTIGLDKVVIPGGFYKILIDVYTREVLVFEFKHQPSKAKLDTFIVSLDRVQAHTGIAFPIPNGATFSTTVWTSKAKSSVRSKQLACNW